MTKKYTHTGIIEGITHWTKGKSTYKMRETKLYWITQSMGQYRKDDGRMPGKYNGYKLLLDTIKPIEEK